MSHHFDRRLAWRAVRTLQALERAGLNIRVDLCPQCATHHRLVVWPASKLTDELREWIRRDKEVLLEIVYRTEAVAEAEALMLHE